MHFTEADRLLAHLKGGPAQTIDKIESGIEEAQATHAALSAASESARELHRLWTSNEAARLSPHRGDWTRDADDFGAPVYTATTRDKTWVEPIAEQLRRDWRAWQRAKAGAERLEAAWHTHAYLHDLLAWRTDEGRSVALVRHEPPAPKLAKSQGHADAVAEIRERLLRIEDRRRIVENAPARVDEIIGRVEIEVDRIARLGEIRLNAARRDGPAFDLEGLGISEVRDGFKPGITGETLVWVFADEIKSKLAAKIRAAHLGEGISDFDWAEARFSETACSATFPGIRG